MLQSQRKYMYCILVSLFSWPNSLFLVTIIILPWFTMCYVLLIYSAAVVCVFHLFYSIWIFTCNSSLTFEDQLLIIKVNFNILLTKSVINVLFKLILRTQNHHCYCNLLMSIFLFLLFFKIFFLCLRTTNLIHFYKKNFE